jgi:two-component system osmolarity sensor histidine kinase EnvZ
VKRLLPSGLFARTLLTLTLSFGLLAVLTLGAVVYYALVPIAKRSAEDLAAFTVLSAQTWFMLPPNLRQDYSEKLYEEHNIWLTQSTEPIPDKNYFLPYVRRVELALEDRLGAPLPIRTQVIDGRRWFWIDLAVGEAQELVRVGFPRDRIRTRPLTGLLVTATGVLILVLLSSALLARQITRPLTSLSAAAERVGEGRLPEALSERGPRELRTFVVQFNRMALRVQELLANRTTLLAGISHDLRTPISRIRLALEMVPEGPASELIERMKGDLEHMNRLIAQSMELARDLKTGECEQVDLADLIDGLVLALRHGGHQVDWTAPGPCPYPVNVTAVQRILNNLAENALRYGGGSDPPRIELDCGAAAVEIRVLDRGPGIPDQHKEAVFRPFYRIEASRSQDTGGSGLGLAIARQLAEANQYRITLQDRPGGGTVACVRLGPCRDEEPPVRAPQAHAGATSSTVPRSLGGGTGGEGR